MMTSSPKTSLQAIKLRQRKRLIAVEKALVLLLKLKAMLHSNQKQTASALTQSKDMIKTISQEILSSGELTYELISDLKALMRELANELDAQERALAEECINDLTKLFHNTDHSMYLAPCESESASMSY
jgi:hypothetical protein